MDAKLSGRQFEISLAMAGAISAGAYSGGVFDFLMQALDEWEKARCNDDLGASIPNHRVGIKAMAGASAGAITGAIGAIALNGGLLPAYYPASAAAPARIKYVFPALYQAWVVRPTLVSKVGEEDFLSLSDLADRSKPITSLLNANLLGTVRDEALRIAAPPAGSALPAYIASTLHMYMTLTNMRGVPYGIEFKGGNYGMMSYADRRYYRIVGSGSWSTGSDNPFTNNDVGTTLSAAALFAGEQPTATWQEFGTASLASGAFPLGLAPVEQKVSAQDYVGRQWPLDNLQLFGPQKISLPQPSADFPGADADGRYSFISIDGGVLNNEPFEYAHYALMKINAEGDKLKPNPREGKDADRAVIMIDPFPEPPDFPAPGSPDAGLMNIIVALFPMLKTEARFKPVELILAGAEHVYSRFLIGPHRTLPGQKKEQLYPIACGLLGGFGGFLDQSFRDHDYQLGRRNCQRFLRQVFTLPGDNPIILGWPQAARDDAGFRQLPDADAPDAIPEYSIIPLLGSAAEEVQLLPWPQMSQADFDALQPRIKARVEAILDRLVGDKASKSVMLKLVAKIGVLYGKGKILDFIKNTIYADLIRRNQIQGWELPAQWKKPQLPLPDENQFRAVWAELLNPAYDFFSVAGIAAKAKLKPEIVLNVLLMSQAEDNRPFSVYTPPQRGGNGTQLYVLNSRKPGLLARLPVTRNIGDWWNSPNIL